MNRIDFECNFYDSGSAFLNLEHRKGQFTAWNIDGKIVAFEIEKSDNENTPEKFLHIFDNKENMNIYLKEQKFIEKGG